MYALISWERLFSLILLAAPWSLSHLQAQTFHPTANHTHPVHGTSIHLTSFETDVTGFITLPISLDQGERVLKDFRLHVVPGPAATWLKDWHVVKQPSGSLSTFEKNQYETTVRLQYAPRDRPYSYRRIKICLINDAGDRVSSANIYLYFTPYDTVEVWNEDDFVNLNRRWDRSRQNEQPRQKLTRDVLPAEAWFPAIFTGEAKPHRMMRFPGLAYAIPMREEAFPAKQIRGKTDTFSGTLAGQIVTDVNGSNLSIVDIAVEVWEQGAIGSPDTLITTGFTGEDGLFSIDFEIVRTGLSVVSTYLVVSAHNQSDMIRVRTRLGAIRSETDFSETIPGFLPNTPATYDFGTLTMDNTLARPQLLHWANRARQFVDRELPGFLPTDPSQRLDIMRSFNGSDNAYFFPGGFTWDLIFVSGFIFGQTAPVAAVAVGGVGAIFISNKDGIYFGSERALNENTVYHEFGHYLMWHLQNESWIDIIQAGFTNHSAFYNNNNPKLSWTEGFATGFANIVDTWCQSDDGEFSTETFGNLTGDYEKRELNGVVLEGKSKLSHGFVSEYNNGAILYDLWDGPTQTLRDGTTLANASDYDDGGFDDIELSFAQIVQPLRDNEGTGGFHMTVALFGVTFGNDQEQYLLTDITEYHQALLDLPSIDCDFGREITDLFDDDLVSNYNTIIVLERDRLSSDFLEFTRAVSTMSYDSDGNSSGFVSHDFVVDVPELRHEEDEYNIAHTGVGGPELHLSDDLLVTGTPGAGSAKLRFNDNLSFGWQDSGNSYGASTFGLPATGHLDIDLCGNMALEVNEGARIIVGSRSAQTATVRLKSGSTLILGGDHTGQILDLELTYGTMVSMGTLIIRNNSRLIVEEGATLIFNRGGNIKLPGPHSILEIHGNLEIADSANFRPEGNGKVIFGLPDFAGAPNVTVHTDSVITFFEMDIQVLEKTYVRPNDNSTARVFMQFGNASMGPESYVHTGIGPLFVEFWNVFPTQPQTRHQGLWVNNASNLIENASFSGGAPGVWALHGTAPVVIRDSDFLHNDQGILAETGGVNWVGGRAEFCAFAGIEGRNASIYVEDVSFSNNGHGIYSDGGNGTLDNVDMFFNGIGWHALNPTGNLNLIQTQLFNQVGSGMEIYGDFINVNLSYCSINQNQDGLLAKGDLNVRLTCSETMNNAQSGLSMKNGARLDLGNSAMFAASGNDVNLLLEDARVPILDFGQNFWTTTNPGDFNIQGTVRGGICECILNILGSCSGTYDFSNITGDLFFRNNTFATPGIGQAIDITDAGTGNCSYTTVTSASLNNCPP